MPVLIAIALKSLLIAGVALGLLALMKQRSAAERSWVAHIGLLALVMLALAPLVLPSWTVEAPSLLGQVPAAQVETAASLAAPASAKTPVIETPRAVAPVAQAPRVSLSATAATMALYAVPAAILLFVTLLALARLIALMARAEVLVDGHWLSALARAQRRMGFKHGTALLTSNELSSPISWGVIRPVILLNNRAVEASSEAEAIIAHELAHVARLDWAKLLLGRVATALFWFNPLVWMLAREAHQLREETADDAVLAADIADTDYAQLLVGVARHECPGLLLGAHGVAPSKSSLARRVARVLDGKSVRGPVARSFAAGVLVGAVMIAAPLAALTLAPGGSKAASEAAPAKSGKSSRLAPYYAPAAVPADLPHIIASGVSTSVAAAVAAAAPRQQMTAQQARMEAVANAVAAANGATRTALVQASQAADHARAVARVYAPSDSEIDDIIQMKQIGVTPQYVSEMRAVSPRLARLEPSEFAGMKAVGVTAEFARSLAAAGFQNIDEDELTEARAVGVTGDYVRALRSAGVVADIDDFVQLRAVGVKPEYVQSLRRQGYVVRSADKLVEMWAVGIKPGDLPMAPPRPPRPPRVPADPDPNPNPDPDDDGG
ncbi:MAG TPA: M56 family metallopeptidase [Sphingomicrobium sp.]|nr:M56 family metallopeptidase [Sphingomicrobium sp.]